MKNFIALDFETSGLDPKRHAPVTIGAARFENGEVCAEFHETFAPPRKDNKIVREYDLCALQVSGIMWKEILSGAPVSRVMELLGKWAGGASAWPVVAFDAPFDLAFYSECLFLGGSWNQAMRRFETFKPPLVGPWQCARMVAVCSLDLPGYSLDNVAEHFGLSRSTDKHGALEDAKLAGHIYHRLTTDAQVTA